MMFFLLIISGHRICSVQFVFREGTQTGQILCIWPPGTAWCKNLLFIVVWIFLAESPLSSCPVPPALENEVMLNPKPSLVDRSILGLSVDKLVPPDIYVDSALLRGRLASNDLPVIRQHPLPWGDSADPDTDSVAEAKARIRQLHEEAEALEEDYKSYQQRAARSTLTHTLPQRARSPQAAHLPQFSTSPLGKRLSHSRSPQRSKVAAAVSDDWKGVASAQPRVVFMEESSQTAARASFLKEVALQDGRSSSPRHPTSSWCSSPKTTLRRQTAEGKNPSDDGPPKKSHLYVYMYIFKLTWNDLCNNNIKYFYGS